MPISARLQREWFEQVARPIGDLAAEPSSSLTANPREDLLAATRYLRYDIDPLTAVALVKANLGKSDRLLSEATRQYLKALVVAAEDLVRARARPSDPPGCKHQLTAYEERRLVREWRALTRFFERCAQEKARRRRPPQCRGVTLAEVNAELAMLYPGNHFSRVEIREDEWLEILKTRSPRRRAMQVLWRISSDVGVVYPVGIKAIEALCYRRRKSDVNVEPPINPPQN
jgi:hypothetical protein